MPDEGTSRLHCFLAIPSHKDYLPVREALRKGIHEAGARSIALEEQSMVRAGLMEAVQEELSRADCLIADVTSPSPQIFFEIGLAQAMGKGIFLCAKRGDAISSIPSDLQGHVIVHYDMSPAGLAELTLRLTSALSSFRRLPRRARFMPSRRYAPSFSVDWDQLETADAENLCRELLAQMGYQRVDWAKHARAIDLVAELPKKDPDGFEYRELWLVSMGRHMPPEALVHEADYVVYDVLRQNKYLSERVISRYANAPITVLLILFKSISDSDDLDRLRMRINREGPFSKEFPYGPGFRFRLWDRAYLTTLIQQFPQIGYKYFSDEGRARSKYRKSSDELYAENVALLSRQVELVRNLEDEKNRRVRAERDAIWKDISFSAAHKIGNPIFAIETDLNPLKRRVFEGRKDEAADVITNIGASVEKAKAIIDQFKSLTRAQELKPTTTRLRPILEDSLRVPKSSGVECTLECPEDLEVNGDPERLAECFDELAVNCTHWFDKPEKRLSIVACRAESLPPVLDSNCKYASVHVRDNGKGVLLENKEKIFDAFFTTYEHGTGLGLALVRRIIDGHGGTIAEMGKPGQGADFEIYLPRASTSHSKKKLMEPTRSRVDGAKKPQKKKSVRKK